MGEDIVGRPVNAVLAPPQAERFATVTGVDLSRLVLNVTGWNKLVLLDCDRVFLFRARWRPPFACGTRLACSPIRAIPPSLARSRST